MNDGNASLGAEFDPANLAHLREVGGPELVQQIVAFALRAVPVRIAAMQDALRGTDVEACARAAHSLQSSAGNVGAVAVQRLAAQIERTADTAGPAQAQAILPDLTTLVTDAQAAWQRAAARLTDYAAVKQPDNEERSTGGAP